LYGDLSFWKANHKTKRKGNYSHFNHNVCWREKNITAFFTSGRKRM